MRHPYPREKYDEPAQDQKEEQDYLLELDWLRRVEQNPHVVHQVFPA